MQFASIIAVALGLTTALVNGRPLEELNSRNLAVYATFYDDTACSVNGGEAVDTTNPGCLEEGGRNSIYYQSATNAGQYPAQLIVSPASGCNCQITCIDDAGAGNAYCMDLTKYANAANQPSYRFIGTNSGGSCPANNC